MTLENLEKILSQYNMKCEKTISETANPVKYTMIASIEDSNTSKKKYGVISVVFENKDYNVDKTNFEVLIPLEYSNIQQIKIENSNEIESSNTMKCTTNKGHVDLITIDSQQNIKKNQIYGGVIISQNPHLLAIKKDATYYLLRKQDCKLLGTYTNEEVVDMQLCDYKEDAETFFDIQDFATITTKKDTKKLLPIVTPLVGEHKNEALFLEPTEEFDSIRYCYNWVDNGNGLESGFTFLGIRTGEQYNINVRQDDSIEIINLTNKKSRNM